MKTSPITTKQKQIISHLYKFRFLNTHQIQTLLEHKNSNRTQAWLKDLFEKNYVKRHYERKSFIDNTKPAIYFLGLKARHFLIKEIKLNPEDLEYVYQEQRREKKFINHCLFLADVFLFLQSQQDSTEELKFFTKNELRRYEYFPDPIPDAFITQKVADTTKRYFLDLFDEYTPPFVLRNRVRMYFEYTEKPDWDENTDFAPFPSILFICPNDSIKKHINHYAKSLLEKTFDDKIKLFLTTKQRLEIGSKNSLWEKVDI